MKKYIWCLIIALIAVSCREEAVPKPDNLLSKEKMAEILYDVTLMNSIKGVNKKKLEENNMHLDTYLYKKHETDSLQFLSSNNYYAANPMIYNEIYGLVATRLQKERKDVGKELDAEQKRRDSVQAAKKAAKEAERKKNDTLPKPKFDQAKKKK
ncbi:DUF4296 domain-containing protein [Kordia sp. YSTF-M3]|uniref:DUF4296 domain-containing protein n=1 Tax=Kordia aestuariivivens TaxID=2759037 RepID=A0ABR7QB26_9FLAO|nr:DUF4296 domain-containing protein [Kordia aestuariivivens]MBC8755524.1 DUF4296 domain-containing protein [Kordia aestuariivivens]